MNDFYVNANGGLPTPNLFNLILMRSGLQWEMHSAQLYGLEMLALERSTRIDYIAGKEVTGEEAKELGPETKLTLMGIPVITSQDYPKGLIRLMYEGKEVSRIEHIAIPCGFADYSEKETQSEREKMAAIGYRHRLTQETTQI